MDKTILHLHLYLYNNVLVEIARKNIKKFKDYGFKILITSGLEIPSDFYEFCDYIFIDHENPSFIKKYVAENSVFFYYDSSFVKLEYHRYYEQFHCLAVLRSIIKGCKIANLLGYENIIKLVYDCSLGPISFEKINYYSTLLESSSYDMIFYENIKEDSLDSDLSGQVMFYRCSPIIELFDGLDNEETYVSQTEKFGYGKIILDLERFMYNTIKSSNKNILFLEENLFFNDYPDTKFNTILSTRSADKDSGFLFDVNHVFEKEIKEHDKIAVTCYNQHSSIPNTLKYELYDENWGLILSDNISCHHYNGHQYKIYNYIELKIKYVKMTHVENNSVQFYSLSFSNDLKIFSNENEYHSKLIIK